MRDNLINIYGEIKINYPCTRIFIPLSNHKLDSFSALRYDENRVMFYKAGASYLQSCGTYIFFTSANSNSISNL